jgi:hypothetical protein
MLCLCAIMTVGVVVVACCAVVALQWQGELEQAIGARWNRELDSVVSRTVAATSAELRTVLAQTQAQAVRASSSALAAETYAAMAGAPVGELSGFEGLDAEAVQGFTVSSVGGDVGEDSTRRLSVFANIASIDSASSTAGCVTVDLSNVNVSKDLSNDTACNGAACPSCYIIDTCHANYSLELTGCSSSWIGKVQMGYTSAWTNSLRSFTFVNADASNYAVISDGTTEHIIGPQTYAFAFCYSLVQMCFSSRTTILMLVYTLERVHQAPERPCLTQGRWFWTTTSL